MQLNFHEYFLQGQNFSGFPWMPLLTSFTKQASISLSSHMMHIHEFYKHAVYDLSFLLVLLFPLNLTNSFAQQEASNCSPKCPWVNPIMQNHVARLQYSLVPMLLHSLWPGSESIPWSWDRPPSRQRGQSWLISTSLLLYFDYSYTSMCLHLKLLILAFY